MKVIIQIPCYNEEASLEATLNDLPRTLPGIEAVEWLLIDDGSADRSAEIAQKHGVHHVLVRSHEGLAKTFLAGIAASLLNGADIIVNTDADNQYNAADIPKLIEPIVQGKAQIVIGERPISTMSHFSGFKKLMQKIGSFAVRLISKTTIQDAPSGFRAISKSAAERIRLHNNFSYTLEMIIQAGSQGTSITSVPIRINHTTRPSKLSRNSIHYIWKSMVVMLRSFAIYRPLSFVAFLFVPFLAVVLLLLWPIL